MKSSTLLKTFAVVATLIALGWGLSLPAPKASAGPAKRTGDGGSLRVAAIGVINDQEFWAQLVARFEQATNIKVETVATGKKDSAADLFRKGGIDLITMQSSEALVGLVADGSATDVQPWLRSDLVLVGPRSDPAKVKGSANLADAIRRISSSGSPFVVHDSSGALSVLLGVTQANGIEMPPASITFLLDDHQRRVFTVASERKAYTLISRVPFITGKLQRGGLELMLAGDEKLCRTHVLAIADPNRFPKANVADAKAFAEFLLSESTQKWISEFGRGKWDAQSMFFPLTGDQAKPAASHAN